MGAIKFIDITTSNVFNGDQPYIFWFDAGQSVNIQYVKQICFVSAKENITVTINEDDSYVFSLLDTSKIIVQKTRNVDLADLKTTKIISQGTEYKSGVYVHMIYILASSTDVGEHIGQFTIGDETFSIGADFYIEDERLLTTLSNFGVEIPDYVQRAIYESNIHEPAIDNILMNRKWKELLLEYINIVANKGSYNSLINSLKWFEWGDLVTIQEYWKYMNYDKQMLRSTELMSITSDELQTEMSNYVKTTYIGLFAALDKLVYENGEIEYDDHFNANEGYLSSGGVNAKGRSAYTNLSLNIDLNADNRVLQIGGVEGTNRISHVSDLNEYGDDATGAWFHRVREDGTHIIDEDNPKLMKETYMWGYRDIALKMTLLGNYFETYFMPIHLDLLHATIQNHIYTNTIKVLHCADINRFDTIDHTNSVHCSINDNTTLYLQDVQCYVYPDTPFSKQYDPIIKEVEEIKKVFNPTSSIDEMPLDGFELSGDDEWTLLYDGVEYAGMYGETGYGALKFIRFTGAPSQPELQHNQSNDFCTFNWSSSFFEKPITITAKGISEQVIDGNWEDFIMNPNITVMGVDTDIKSYNMTETEGKAFDANVFGGIGAILDITFTIPNKDKNRFVTKISLYDNDSKQVMTNNVIYSGTDIVIPAKILIRTTGKHILRFEFITNSGEYLVRSLTVFIEDNSWQPIELYKIKRIDYKNLLTEHLYNDVVNCPNFMFSQHNTTNQADTFKLSKYSQFLPYSFNSDASFGLNHFVKVNKNENEHVLYNDEEIEVNTLSIRLQTLNYMVEDGDDYLYAINPKFHNTDSILTHIQDTILIQDNLISIECIQQSSAILHFNITGLTGARCSCKITEKSTGRTVIKQLTTGIEMMGDIDLGYIFNITNKSKLDFEVCVEYAYNGSIYYNTYNISTHVLVYGELDIELPEIVGVENEDECISELRLFPIFHEIVKLESPEIKDGELIAVVPNIPLSKRNDAIETMWTFINESTDEQISYNTSVYDEQNMIGTDYATVQQPIVFQLGEFENCTYPNQQLPQGYYSIKLQYSMDGENIDETILHHAFHKI